MIDKGHKFNYNFTIIYVFMRKCILRFFACNNRPNSFGHNCTCVFAWAKVNWF